MKINELIGFQLVSISNDSLVVGKNGLTFAIHFDLDHGDCCGYADITNTLYIDTESTKNNPIITGINFDSNDADGENQTLITFFGFDITLASIEANTGSGSGWQYGATVTARCDALKIEEIISQW